MPNVPVLMTNSSRQIAALLVVLAALIGSVVFIHWETEPTPVGGPVVSATMFPLYDIARAVGDGVVDVNLLLPPGASPHTFEVTPQTVRIVEQSDLVFMIGYGLDDWVTNLVNDKNRLVIVDDGVTIRPSQEEEQTGGDPHYWLDVKNAMQIARTIAVSLERANPEKSPWIQSNLRSYLSELEALDGSLREQLSGIATKKMITFHDAWYYFADAYGLEITATFEPAAGREPTPQYLAELSRTIEQTGVRVVYAEPQFSKESLRAFLSDYDVGIVTIDPLGGTAETDSYIKLMQSNAAIISHNQ